MAASPEGPPVDGLIRLDVEWAQALGRIIAEQDGRPFGDAEFVSGRTMRQFSLAGQEAATNLLTKAVRALDGDQPERARRYVDRAVRLPYDRHEETEPVAMAAHMMMFTDVTDAVEGAAADDSAWLNAAIADVPPRAELGDLRLDPREMGDCVMSVLAVSATIAWPCVAEGADADVGGAAQRDDRRSRSPQHGACDRRSPDRLRSTGVECG